MQCGPPTARDTAPAALLLRAGERLYTAISGMSAAAWQDPAQLNASLAHSEALLCSLHPGCGSLSAYAQWAAGGGGGGGPCTRVWTAGTIAYRCRTCGLSPSAAVCVECFRANDHEGHDYVMYTSDAGGCCDCGDMSSWRPSGCCPRYRPPGEGDGAGEPPSLPAADDAVLRGVVGCVLARLQLALEATLPSATALVSGQPTREQQQAVALRLMGWLVLLGQAPALRRIICEELLQPAAASAAAQAASLAATSAAPPEAAAVARMLQQQREQLLQALEAVLPVPEGEPSAAPPSGRPLPLLGPGPHQHSLLYWQLASLLPLNEHLVEELASLQILLLYSTPYKEAFGRLLLAFYPHIGALGKRHAITKALDRLTVQVFHLEETTLALVQHDRLLEVLLGCLLDTLRGGLGANGLLNGDSQVLTGRLYLRIAADLHMCLSHRAVALQLLSPGAPQAPLFASHFLEVFRLIQGASPFRRKQGEHVLYESQAWVNCVQAEVHMMHMLKQGVLHTLLKAAEEGTVPAAETAQALAYGLGRALEAVEAAAGPIQTAEEPHSFWASVLTGQSQISAHIPLERMATAFLAGLLHLAHTSSEPQPYLEAAAAALGGQAAEGAEAAARRWEMCGLSTERITGWMSQIRQRMWVRNGQQLLRLEAFYSSPYWSDHGLDADLLSMQAWLASTPNLSRALGYLTVDSHAVHLLRASSAQTLEEGVHLLQDARGSQELLRCAADWLRLLVILLRERSVWHPTYSPLQLRRAVVHILAAGARSHSEVGDELPYELAHSEQLEQVLTAVADYQPPTAATTGRYSLKRDRWREFDPFYPHYGRRDLQSALHAAQEGGMWQPEWQLHAGLPPLPEPLTGLQRMLHHTLRIVWASLLLACCGGGDPGGKSGEGGSGGAAEDCALAATNLLFLALQRKRHDLAALVTGQDASPGAPPLPETWRSPAGFRAKCEEHLAGTTPARPGIIYLLRVLAGAEAWVDGSRREASWELKQCAAVAAAEAQALLQAARQAAPGELPAPALEEAEGAAAAGGQPAAEAAAGQPAGGATPATEGDASARKKQRQQQMLARMRAQQAKAAAALLEEESEEEEEAPAAAAAAEQASADAEGAAPMDVDAAAGGPAAAASRRALPAHHPAAWERLGAGAECCLCHSGCDAAPLGLVAQLQVSELPALAAGDPAAPLTPEHPGLPGGALGALDPDAADPQTRAPFPLPGAGPRLSVFDRQPSMHLLCCGHMLHASCLESYRASWRQRIASGQFVEGYQLLNPSPPAGEYLCPICRRLGNCLVPAVVAAPSPADALAEGGEQQLREAQPLSSQTALQRLHQLLVDGDDNWATATVTADPQLLRQWQQHADASGAIRTETLPLLPVSLILLPLYGSQAAGVAALCSSALHLGSKWLVQQERVLEWLQHRATEHPVPLLWGIPVAPAAVEPANQPPQPPAQTLQAALQQLLDQAVDAGGDPEAIGAVAAAAAAVAAMEEEALAVEEDEEGSEEEEEEEEEEAGDVAALRAGGRGLILEELQHVAAQRAAAIAGSVEDPHSARMSSCSSQSVLWSLLGGGLVQWEVAHRDPACVPSSEMDAAQWRALLSVAQLAMSASIVGSRYTPTAALGLLQRLAEGGLQSLGDLAQVPLDMAAVLLPGLQQMQLAPSDGNYLAEQDPFALLLQLLAALMVHPSRSQSGESHNLSCAAHRRAAEVLRSLLALLHPLAVGQAAALATGAAHSAAETAAALASSPPLASALESAVSNQVLPWLQRAALLQALLAGVPVPAPSNAGPAAPAVAALLDRLHLPPLWESLQSPAASSLAPPPGAPGCPLPTSMQLSVRAGQEQWTVAVPPPPAAPQLLQLPASYQGWYLSLGDRQCSACGQLPSEPALCLRCGAVVCCNGRRCLGAARQGMCYTHSWACGGGTSAFLLTKMTRLLVIRKNRATFLPSPYVDSHGEEDLRLQRGKPLSLNGERLRHLLQLWRSNALDFDSHVLHAANRRNESASMY